MYLLLVYNDFDKKNLIFIGQFLLIKDITKFTNNYIKYCDRRKNLGCYRTYKNLFKIVKLNKKLL
jgi:hypothetical protein